MWNVSIANIDNSSLLTVSGGVRVFYEFVNSTNAHVRENINFIYAHTFQINNT